MENEHVSLEGEQVRMLMSCPMCGTDHLVILTLDQYQRFLDSRISMEIFSRLSLMLPLPQESYLLQVFVQRVFLSYRRKDYDSITENRK